MINNQPKQKRSSAAPTAVVIGAGIGGLTAAALLVKAGFRVKILVAGVSPGGSAGTFYHQGYRFDTGATLAGGFNPGGPHARIAEFLGLEWPVRAVDPAGIVHLPERSIIQYADPNQWLQERLYHFPHSDPFWRKQQMLADTSWKISSQPFPWPPVRPQDLIPLLRIINLQTLRASPYAFNKISSLIPSQPGQEFKVFLDAQLFISAQTTSEFTNALYGSAALDLPRRGVNSVINGIGSLSEALAAWIQNNGGVIHYRQQVISIAARDNSARLVTTDKGLTLEPDIVVANLTPQALVDLLKDQALACLRRISQARKPVWGTLMVYLGLDNQSLPEMKSDHHQVIRDIYQPLGEANSIFISLSHANDQDRAPAGMRTATISTHTRNADWLVLAQTNRNAYQERKEVYYERVLQTAERAIPGIRSAVRFKMTGTPKTFEFFTHRPQGMAGGFPQTSLFNVLSPKTGLKNVWMVGDSIFPGQSTAGVTLGAICGQQRISLPGFHVHGRDNLVVGKSFQDSTKQEHFWPVYFF